MSAAFVIFLTVVNIKYGLCVKFVALLPSKMVLVACSAQNLFLQDWLFGE